MLWYILIKKMFGYSYKYEVFKGFARYQHRQLLQILHAKISLVVECILVHDTML